MYSITFDSETGMLLVTTEGCWTIATALKFAAEVLAKLTAIRLRHGAFRILVDARTAAVQPREVVGVLELLVPKVLKISSSPIAVVAGSHLLKLQTERYLKGDNGRVFLDMAEAEAWLRGPTALAA